jgi:hypothetical protein
MKYIVSFLQKFLPKELPKPLGRWNIEKCNEKLKLKVDMTNEDHCGPCGQYVQKKKNDKDSKIYSSNSKILTSRQFHNNNEF